MDFLKNLLGGGGGTNANTDARREYEELKAVPKQVDEFSRMCRAGDTDGAMRLLQQIVDRHARGRR